VYPASSDLNLSIPTPWLLANKLLPQLSFIRAVGRAGVLFLFALCCLLALLPHYLSAMNVSKKRMRVYGLILGIALFIELMPNAVLPLSKLSYNYNLQIPSVYKYIRQMPEIDNLIVLRGDHGYPGEQISLAQAEDVLWAGYHNRNIYNGYSGYVPDSYLRTYIEFKDFDYQDVLKMKAMDLRYVVVDKKLSTQKPELITNVRNLLSSPLFEDERYALFEVR
jgi:hypothetical protein